MALYFPNSKCSICGETIGEKDSRISFPPFVSNQLDPLIIFNDSNFHKECFNNHHLSSKAIERLEVIKRASKGGHVCDYCKKNITDYNEYFSLSFITDIKENNLFKYNNLQLHKSCIKKHNEIENILELLEELNASGEWAGNGISSVINIIKENIK